MYIVCLYFEGIVAPEMWVAYANASGISQLTRTTRDEPDYDKLMNFCQRILRNSENVPNAFRRRVRIIFTLTSWTGTLFRI